MMHSHDVDDLYGVGELEAHGSAMIEVRECGHDLGDWRLVEDLMRLTDCRICCVQAWIVRLPGEETWRAGGSALNGHFEERVLEKRPWFSTTLEPQLASNIYSATFREEVFSETRVRREPKLSFLSGSFLLKDE